MISQGSFTVSVQSTDPLARRTGSEQDQGSLRVLPAPLVDHVIVNESNVQYSFGFRKVGLHHSPGFSADFYADMTDNVDFQQFKTDA